jgi:uncharacterized protein (TIGR00369 family)
MWGNLGLRIIEAEMGLAVVEGEVSSEAHGASAIGDPSVHRGALATIADAAMACAGVTIMSAGEKATTVDLRVEYFTPALPGKILARAQVRHRSGQMVFCEAKVEQSGTVLAEVRGTIALVPV